MKLNPKVTAGLLILLAIDLPHPRAPWLALVRPRLVHRSGSKPGDYDFGTEHTEGSVGAQAAYIKAKPGATANGFGTLMQTVKADDYLGQRVRVSARLKSAGGRPFAVVVSYRRTRSQKKCSLLQHG